MPAPPLHPDRRLAPRPLPLHLASAMLLWLTSRAGLTSWPSGSPPSTAPAAAGPLGQLAADLARLGPERIAGALGREIAGRAASFVAGIEAYRQHPYRRPETRAKVVWQDGA